MNESQCSFQNYFLGWAVFLGSVCIAPLECKFKEKKNKNKIYVLTLYHITAV